MNLVTGQGRARLLPSRKPDQLGWNLVLPFHPCLTVYIRGFKPTSIRQSTQIAIFFRVLRGSIHPRIPSPSIRAHLCPSVVKKRHALCLPFRVIRVFRGSNNTPIHPWSSVFIRGFKTTTESNRLRWNFALPKKPPLIPCLPWFQKHPETVPKMRIFRISRSGHPQQPRNLFRSGRFRTAKTSVFARAILEQLAQPG